jgi:GNAT superfamily N-acetyltransferase
LEFVFETMKKENIDECVNLILSSMKKQLTPIHRNKEAIKQMLSRSQTTTLVAKKKGRIVGLVGGAAPNVNFVTVLDEESARKGLADMLLNKYEEIVKQQLPSAAYLKASLFTDQPDAVALYSRLGFVIDGFARDFVMGRDMVFMRRRFK